MENAHIDYQLKGKSAFTQPTQGVTTINEKTWKIPNTDKWLNPGKLLLVLKAGKLFYANQIYTAQT